MTLSDKESGNNMVNKISVVIITYNRNKDCMEAVNSILMQRKPPHEIIVIDDASPMPFQFKNSKVKVIRNRVEQGLAISRNIGIQSSTGDIIAFIDDDALAPPDWCEKLQKAFSIGADVVGGPCKPLYLSLPPKWWDEKRFGILVGISINGIIGCNFAVKRETFNKVGYFNSRLGRKSRKLISNEETEFFQRVEKVGGKIIFDKELEVYHKISQNRLTLYYLLRRAWYDGISECIMYSKVKHIRKTFGCFKRLVVFSIKMLLDRKNLRYYLVKIVAQLGFIFGIFIESMYS
ncbi:MAG: glycosyltransferase [Nitrososphaerota archaeon]|nr:glycosyltransferase [Nitrososphaerota archaeon]